ncbi:MAG: hypothetical protein M3Q30_28285, partial [Actinomycetota bacterium]|nr:hypothetical protein [Actinomycetota bacterium]
MTALDELALQVFPGTGVVGRFPDACLAVIPTTARHRSFAEELLTLMDGRASGSGHRLVGDVVAVIANAEADDVPPLCVICAAEENVVLILCGAIEAVLTVRAGVERLSGSSNPSWLERVIEAPIEQLDVAADGTEFPEAAPQLDLRTGLVPGGGFRLRPVSARIENADAVSDDKLVSASNGGFDQRHRHFDASVLTEAEIDEPRSPLPVIGSPGVEVAETAVTANVEAEEAEESRAVIVTGYICSRGHFNGPDAAYCSACGISMVHLTRRPVKDVRPALGYLVLDDGATFLLDRDYVIGRNPEMDPEVQARR